MRLHANEQVAPGHVVVRQPGEVLGLSAVRAALEPGEDSEIEVIVNPADVEAAKAMWFEPKGQMK